MCKSTLDWMLNKMHQQDEVDTFVERGEQEYIYKKECPEREKTSCAESHLNTYVEHVGTKEKRDRDCGCFHF